MGRTTDAGDVRAVTSATEKKYGLPDGTLYKIAGIESSHGVNMLSPKGAKGWFGFMGPTAKEYGVEDPNDLHQSAEGAGKFMRWILDRKADGDMSTALAYYNGGNPAVKALREGRPWDETVDYLKKFHGKAQEALFPARKPEPMGEQFTSQTTVSPTDGPSASQLVVDQRRRDNEFGGVSGFVGNLGRAAALGFETQNTVWNFYKDQAVADVGDAVDWDSDEAKQTLAQFPERHWGYLTEAATKEGLAKRAARLQDTMTAERDLGDMGTALALTGSLAGGLPDLPTLIGFLPVIGGAGLLTKASRLANAARMAAVGGATNVIYDAVANQYKPTATTDDLYMSGLFGLGLGALGGAATSLKGLRLREENLRLREFGLREGAAGLRREIEGPPAPRAIERWDVPHPIREEWLKKIDGWAGGLGRTPPERPRMAILSGPKEDLPVPPKGIEPNPPIPVQPRREPTPFPPQPEPPRAAPKVEPPAAAPNPNGKPWDSRWDTPIYETRMGAKDILTLPHLSKVSELAEYIRTYSKHKDFVALMDRTLKGIDLRKLKFDVVDPKVDFRNLKVSASTARHMSGAYGVVVTPHGSIGDGIEMALRGHGYGRRDSGLNEETFIHELAHVATVYKWRRVDEGLTQGMKAESIQAYKELDKLYRFVKKSAEGRTDLPDRFDVNMANPREFIAYGLTNRPFQDWLKTVQVPGARSTLWGQFVSHLRKLLGIGKGEEHAFARLIDLSNSLIDKSGIEGKAKAKMDLEAGSPIIDADDVAAANAADLSPVFGWGLGLEHRLGGQKVPPKVRSLAAKLFGTTVGRKDHGVVERNAWDDTIARAEGWTAETRKTGYTAFSAWFKETGRPWHEKGQAFEEFGEQVSNYVRGFPGDYHPEVVKAGEKVREINARIVDEINNPAMREGGTKKGLTEVEVFDETKGETVLVGKLEKNPNYLPRKHDSRKWDEAVRTWGRESVESWWANAYAKAHPERSLEDAKKWAGWYVRTVEEAHLNRNTDHLEEMMSGYDERALKESLMRNGGFTPEEADEVIRGMFQKPSSDAGRTASSLRHRNTIAEAHSESWVGKDGKTYEITLNDFIRSNAFAVQESYYRRVASSISLAHRLDVYRQSEIGRLIDDATEKGFGSEVSDAAVMKMRHDLKFAFDRVQGIPQEEWTALNKSLEMWRDFNVIRLMGGAVWNQVSELSQIVGTMGWKATLGAVGELRAMRRDIRTGKAPHDLLDHLENTIGGVGSEYVARLDFTPKDDWVRYKGDSPMNQRLDKLDGGMKKVAKGVLDYTGMTGAMIQQKRVHAIALVNHFVNQAQDFKPGAKGGTQLNPGFLTKDRLAWMGMSEEDYSALKAGIKAYSKAPTKGQYGQKVQFDFKRFAAEKPELNSMLMNAVHRETRRVIQENDLASMVPLMGTTLGKTVFQFMNFVIHGWNKSLMFGMNHRDFSTLSSVMHGAFFASLAYMGRTQLSAMGMSEEDRTEFLAQRMSGKQIVANSFGRISQASLLPQVYDTTIGNFTGAMFSGLRTTSDLSSFASNPTLQAVNSFLSMGKMVRNGLSDETQTTSRDIKTWAKLVPLNNVVPISSFFNSIAADFPYSDQESEDD